MKKNNKCFFFLKKKYNLETGWNERINFQLGFDFLPPLLLPPLQ